MTGLTVYSATASPDRLYSTDNAETVDADTTVAAVWAGHRPLDFVADLAERRLWWTFQADHETKATRQGYFVAAYQGDQNLFRGFASELAELHATDDWTLPYAGKLRRDAGFELWRLPDAVESEDADAFNQLVDRLSERDTADSEPLIVGMASYRSAFQVVRALDAADVECTVGVDYEDDIDDNQAVDLLLVPDAYQDFEVRWPFDVTLGDGTTTAENAESPSQDPSASETTASDEPSSKPGTATSHVRDSGGPTVTGLMSRIAGIVLVGLLGFAAYSFVSRNPVKPITGLATLGGFVGTSAVVWLRYMDARDSRSDPGSWHAVRSWLTTTSEQTVTLLALGTLAGFVFPRLVWELGLLAGRGGFLFGSLSSLAGALPAVGTYIGLIVAITVIGRMLGGRFRGWQARDRSDFRRLALDFVIYGLCLLVLTGFADILWYSFIPSA